MHCLTCLLSMLCALCMLSTLSMLCCRRGEFWIQCDYCDRWFDGKCVQMNEAKAERQKDWRCPFCVGA